ncbi:TIGR03621 family F420-dependent LLM class oxidoreductase [Nocardia callitridis]|uniref:LLM class F420-dependent oxidoreductase n=1 Tax=Nocardia callitridis TaxID=648753 RepID=A0ABP9KRZ4_9NOCA
MAEERNNVTERPFRFGVGVVGGASRAEWREKARRAEGLGFDVLQYADHLGLTSPFPALVTMAEATERVRVGTMVLNAGFYRPALLARDVASVDLLTDGRFEFGLGAGPDFAEPEFEAAGLPFPSPRQRIDHLRETIGEIRSLFAGEHEPPVTRRIPLLVAGSGNRLVRTAAEFADIVSLAGVPTDSIDSEQAGINALGERVEFVRTAAGQRFAEIEVSLMVQALEMPGLETPGLAMARMFNPDRSDEQLRQLPGVLRGSAREIADTLRHYRDSHSVSYFTVTEDNMVAFAKVIEELR